LLPGGFVIVKKGEHGSVLFAGGEVVPLPGYPAQRVVDPTGAGDCFAGALMGYLAGVGDCSHAHLHRAMAYGTVTASLALEDFSLNRLCRIDRAHIDARLAEFERLLNL
jgi:sugar/nucleoside kinase (ribokinase family)